MNVTAMQEAKAARDEQRRQQAHEDVKKFREWVAVEAAQYEYMSLQGRLHGRESDEFRNAHKRWLTTWSYKPFTPPDSSEAWS